MVEQPTVNANRAMTLTMLYEVRICFIFILLLFWFDLVSTIVPIQGFLIISSLFHACHSLARCSSLCEMLTHLVELRQDSIERNSGGLVFHVSVAKLWFSHGASDCVFNAQ